MTVQIGPFSRNQDYTADEGQGVGVHTVNLPKGWHENEKTVIVFEPGNAVGSIDISARVYNGVAFFSMGNISADGGVPVEIEVPAIAEIRIAANGLTANYGYSVVGADL